MPKQRHEGNFWSISHALFLDLGTVTQECSLYKSVSYCTPISLHTFLYAVMLQLLKKAVQWLFFWIFLISMYWIYTGLETPIGLALQSVPLISYYSSACLLDSYCSSLKPATSPPQGLCTDCCFCLDCSPHRYPQGLISHLLQIFILRQTLTNRSPWPNSIYCLLL